MQSRDGVDLDSSLFRALFQANARPMWLYAQEGLSIVAVNEAACALYGWSREELLSMRVGDLRAGDDDARFDRFVEELRSCDDKPSWSRDVAHATKSGATLRVDLENTPLVYQGRPAGLVAVTDLRGASLAERRFRLLVEHSAEGLTITNPETFTLEYVSPGAARLLGATAEELTGAYAGVNTHPDHLLSWDPPAPGDSVVTTTRNRHADGTWRWVESVTTNLIHEPAVRGLVTRCRDVTDQRESERTAREAQHRLEYLLSATSAVMYVARAAGDFGATFITANVKALTGYDAGDFVANPSFWLDHVHPDDRQRIDEDLQRIFELDEHPFQYRFRHADGRFRWMQDVPRVFRDEEGNPKEIVGYWIDVTDRVHAEYALRGSEANFRALIERSPGAIFVHRSGRLIYVNPATVAMLGYESPAELVGCEVLGLIHPDDRDMIRRRMAQIVRDGSCPVVESRMLHRDGHAVTVEAEAVLLDFDGEASSVILARDITERREMFARIAVAERMLSVGTLAAGVAHEINNPIAYVSSNLALLMAELPALLAGKDGGRLSREDVGVLLRDSQEGAARVSSIVRDLLALSRADEHTTGPVDVAAVVRSSLKVAHNEIRHRASVVVDIADELPPVQANASRLGQVFLNLLVNAAQAIPDGHVEANEVRIRAHVSDDRRRVLVDIEDTGTGIPPNVIGRIFDPFFTTKSVDIGTGLGLSISHQIVRSVGGELTVTSSSEKGSCFRVSLPAAPPSSAPAAITAREGRTQPSPRRVLMVDDEPALGRSTRLLLLPDYDVVPVTRAMEALGRIAAGEQFDAILCDLMMPEMNGIEFLEQLERRAPDYAGRVIFLTGGAFTDETRVFLAAPGRAKLEKPFTEEALRLALDAVLARDVAPP